MCITDYHEKAVAVNTGSAIANVLFNTVVAQRSLPDYRGERPANIERPRWPGHIDAFLVRCTGSIYDAEKIRMSARLVVYST